MTDVFDLANCCKNWHDFEDEFIYWISIASAHRDSIVLEGVFTDRPDNLDSAGSIRRHPALPRQPLEYRLISMYWSNSMKTPNFELTVHWKEYSAVTYYHLRIVRQSSPHIISNIHYSSRVAISSDHHSGKTNARFRENSPDDAGRKHNSSTGLRTFSVNLVTEPNSLKVKAKLGIKQTKRKGLTGGNWQGNAGWPVGAPETPRQISRLGLVVGVCIGHGTEHSLFPHELSAVFQLSTFGVVEYDMTVWLTLTWQLDKVSFSDIRQISVCSNHSEISRDSVA